MTPTEWQTSEARRSEGDRVTRLHLVGLLILVVGLGLAWWKFDSPSCTHGVTLARLAAGALIVVAIAGLGFVLAGARRLESGRVWIVLAGVLLAAPTLFVGLYDLREAFRLAACMTQLL